MSLFRMIVLLAGTLLVLLTIAILRVETTRLHYDISRIERQITEQRQQLRASEIELARLQSPMFLRQRLEAAGETEGPQPAGATDGGRQGGR